MIPASFSSPEPLPQDVELNIQPTSKLALSYITIRTRLRQASRDAQVVLPARRKPHCVRRRRRSDWGKAVVATMNALTCEVYIYRASRDFKHSINAPFSVESSTDPIIGTTLPFKFSTPTPLLTSAGVQMRAAHAPNSIQGTCAVSERGR
jgi:hypothetical protein